MKALLLASALLLLPAGGFAQDSQPDRSQDQSQDNASDGARTSPKSAAKPAPADDTGDTSADTGDQPAPKPSYTPTPAPPPATWEPHQIARLQALDKVDGQSATLSVPVGSTQAWRNMTIDVKSCYARPADQAPDATAYLIITDKAAAAPSFVGWMLAAEPSVNLMEHPVYDVRVLGCG